MYATVSARKEWSPMWWLKCLLRGRPTAMDSGNVGWLPSQRLGNVELHAPYNKQHERDDTRNTLAFEALPGIVIGPTKTSTGHR